MINLLFISELPFGFNLAIGQIQNEFNITKDNAPVAGLATVSGILASSMRRFLIREKPLGASTSSITVLGEADTQGTIDIVIADTNLTCPEPQHPTFSAFSEFFFEFCPLLQSLTSPEDANLTSSDIAEFRLVGNSRAIANLSIGQITLDPIKVNVSTHLQGLQGLKGMTQIEGVDVAGGTTDHINLNINGNGIHLKVHLMVLNYSISNDFQSL